MQKGKGVKDKGSSLVIVPLTILDNGTFTTLEVAANWHWLYNTMVEASSCPR